MVAYARPGRGSCRAVFALKLAPWRLARLRGTGEVAAPNLGLKAQVDVGQGDDGSEGWDILLGWKSAKGAELEVRFPEPMEPKKPQQPGRVPGSQKAAEHYLSGSHFNRKTFERWVPWERPQPADYRALFLH